MEVMVKEERWTPPRLAQELGVTQQRVRQLIEAGRVEGVRVDNDRYSFPAYPRILRAPVHQRPSPLLDYIEQWERDHPSRVAESITGEGQGHTYRYTQEEGVHAE